MDLKTLRSITIISLVLGIVLTAFCHLLLPVNDSDFFWHLKTGEWIWQNKTLPLNDPFAYTTGTLDSRTHFILTSYWGSQLLYYLFYAIGGMGGIIILRFVIVGMLIYFILKRRDGDLLLSLALSLIFLTALLSLYSFERPQVFSFLFFAALLYLMSSIRNSADIKFSYRPVIFLSVIMVLWANSHGGVVIGQGTIIAYIVIEGLKLLHPALKPMKVDRYRYLLCAALSGLVFSLINPNTYHTLFIMSSSLPDTSHNSEFLSTIKNFSTFGDYSMVIYWGLLLLAIAGLLLDLKRFDIVEFVLLAGTGVASFLHVRYIAFFLIVAVPAIGRFFTEGLSLRAGRIFRVLIVLVALYAGVYFTWDERNNIGNLISGNWIRYDDCPVRAADFIIANDLRGAMYNHYNFGGYLIWRLGPERKVFTDGRVLFDDVYEKSQLVNVGYSKLVDGLPYWKSVLKSYGVGYVVTPIYESSGQICELLNVLMQDKDWVPVFFDGIAVIFVNNSPENDMVIRRYAISGEHLRDSLIWFCDIWISINPQNFMAYIAKGDLLVKQARFTEARRAYERALEIFPSNSTAEGKLRLLKNLYGS